MSNVAVDQGGVDIVKYEGVGRVHEEGETESGFDPWLGPAGEEEFDPGNCSTNRPRTERIADDDSSSLHSSRASITVTAETPVT